MVMADSAFERVDVGHFKHGINYDVGGACVALSRNEFTEFADTKTCFFHFSPTIPRYHAQSRL